MRRQNAAAARRATILALALISLGAPAALAQEEAPAVEPAEVTPEPPPPPRATSLDELLQRVRSGWRAEQAENRRREQEFRANRAEQERLLQQALAQQASEEARSEQLETTFEENELTIAEQEELLAQRLGTLGELFGVVRQVAGDTRGQLDTSIITAQFPDRDPELGALAESKSLPSIDQLRNLWSVLLQEAVESGKVVRFPATVVGLGGERMEREVVRVGAFNLVSGGDYLTWKSTAGSPHLAVLGRQPERKFHSTVSNLESSSEGLVRFALDPARGKILELLVDLPSFTERLEFGGAIGYTIIALGSGAFLVGLLLLVRVLLTSRKVASQRNSATPSESNPLGRILGVYEANKDEDLETLELKMEEAIIRESTALERFQWLVKIVSAVAPLMGLLGTVTGMINTFQAITLFGTGDPKMMASGISEALVTTMLGLYAAIPLVLMYSVLSSTSRGVVSVLEEQSAGMIATRAEQERGGHDDTA